MSLKETNTNQNSNHKAIGILVISLTLLALCTPMLISVLNDNRDSVSSRESKPEDTSLSNLNTCIGDANVTYNTQWKVADKDGDGQVAYSDGASSITTNYYDSIISCYQSNKVDSSESVIADYQQKRQQENDRYSAWLSSSNQPAGRKPMTCVSNAVGSTAYTNCY